MLIGSLIAGLQAVEAAQDNSKTITVPDDYSTIQAAINNAANGDTIYIKKGVYVENPVVNRSISLVGEDRESTVIDVTEGLKVEANNSTITGLTIYDGWRGISLSASYCNISGNKITDSTNGIVLFGCEGNSIIGNIFKSIGLSSAIQLNYANKNLVNNNYIDSCVEGIQIWQHSSNNTIIENTIRNIKATAIGFQYSNYNTINRNNISYSDLGTAIYGSSWNTISNNNYFYNKIQFNANESYYLTFGNNRSINTIVGNYWSDYNGTDSNKDGIGDVPYIIDEYNNDPYPIMLPINTDSSFNLTPTPTATPTALATPIITIFSPQNNTYRSTSIPLNFTINEPTTQISYSLNGQANITVAENTTLTDVPNGYHSLTLYAKDIAGNTRSETVHFTITAAATPLPSSPTQQSTPSPSAIPYYGVDYTPRLIIIVLVALAVVVGLLVYFKKKRR